MISLTTAEQKELLLYSKRTARERLIAENVKVYDMGRISAYTEILVFVGKSLKLKDLPDWEELVENNVFNAKKYTSLAVSELIRRLKKEERRRKSVEKALTKLSQLSS